MDDPGIRLEEAVQLLGRICQNPENMTKKWTMLRRDVAAFLEAEKRHSSIAAAQPTPTDTEGETK